MLLSEITRGGGGNSNSNLSKTQFRRYNLCDHEPTFQFLRLLFRFTYRTKIYLKTGAWWKFGVINLDVWTIGLHFTCKAMRIKAATTRIGSRSTLNRESWITGLSPRRLETLLWHTEPRNLCIQVAGTTAYPRSRVQQYRNTTLILIHERWTLLSPHQLHLYF
jgi:hypothetical protein